MYHYVVSGLFFLSVGLDPDEQKMWQLPRVMIDFQSPLMCQLHLLDYVNGQAQNAFGILLQLFTYFIRQFGKDS